MFSDFSCSPVGEAPPSQWPPGNLSLRLLLYRAVVILKPIHRRGRQGRGHPECNASLSYNTCMHTETISVFTVRGHEHLEKTQPTRKNIRNTTLVV